MTLECLGQSLTSALGPCASDCQAPDWSHNPSSQCKLDRGFTDQPGVSDLAHGMSSLLSVPTSWCIWLICQDTGVKGGTGDPEPSGRLSPPRPGPRLKAPLESNVLCCVQETLWKEAKQDKIHEDGRAPSWHIYENCSEGWARGSGVQHLPSMCEVLDSISRCAKP